MSSLNTNAPAIGVFVVLISFVISTGLHISTSLEKISTKIDTFKKEVDIKFDTKFDAIGTNIDTVNNSLRDILLNHEGRITTNTVKVELGMPQIK